MDDLKVVLYIIVAIIWVVYNNYKKISETSRKRDPSRPHGEVIPEAWPSDPGRTVRRDIPPPKKAIEKTPPVERRKVLERAPLPGRKPIRKPSASAISQTVSQPFSSSEGGTISPSKVVHFEEPAFVAEVPHPMLEIIRNMDLKHGVVLAEVLKRPYT